jgi:peptidoglycan/LPS O-acetylase OafA/YrhL
MNTIDHHGGVPEPIKIRERTRNSALTGIRGLAACWVVVFHAYEALQSLSLVPARDDIPIVRSGYLGVDLFFLLSGFILTLTYSKSMSRISLAGIRHFAIGRVFRILPLHWFMLGVLVAAVALAPVAYWGPGPFTLKSFVASAFLIQGWIGQPIAWNAPTWSLSAEWLSYLFFVPLIGFAARVQTAAAARFWYMVCLVPFFAILLMVHSTTLDHAERLGSIRCLCEFSAGVMLCRMYQTSPVTKRVGTASFWIGLSSLAVAVAFRSVEMVAVLGFSCLIFSSAVMSVPSQNLFGNRVVHFLGEISYSIYLMHLTLINLGLALARSAWCQQIGGFLPPGIVAVCTVGVIPLSWITWRLIELPGQRQGRCLNANNLQRNRPTRLGTVHLEGG